MMTAIMDVVFHCSELAIDESITEPDIASRIVNEIAEKVKNGGRDGIPESIRSLQDVGDPLREGICSSLQKKLTGVHQLQRSIWFFESAHDHPLVDESTMQLVESLKLLRSNIERKAAIRGVVERNSDLFEAVNRETNKRFIFKGRAVQDRLGWKNNTAEFDTAFIDVYNRCRGYE